MESLISIFSLLNAWAPLLQVGVFVFLTIYMIKLTKKQKEILERANLDPGLKITGIKINQFESDPDNVYSLNFRLKNEGPGDAENIKIEKSSTNNDHEVMDEKDLSIKDTEIRNANFPRFIKKLPRGDSVPFHCEVTHPEAVFYYNILIREEDEPRWYLPLFPTDEKKEKYEKQVENAENQLM